MRIIITGASGVLGSAVREAFARSPQHSVLALSNTRSGEGLTQLNLLDAARVQVVFGNFKPDFVVHCAAERRPDVAAKVRGRSHRGNITVSMQNRTQAHDRILKEL